MADYSPAACMITHITKIPLSYTVFIICFKSHVLFHIFDQM